MKPIALGLLIAASLSAQLPPDDDIRAILTERIDHLHLGVGIVVGIVDRAGRHFVSYGTFGLDDARPVGADTVFQIGSVTKLFTSTVLADMVQRGEVALDDPVAPVNAEFVFRDSTGRMRRVVVEYRNHRHFEASTKLNYDKVN